MRLLVLVCSALLLLAGWSSRPAVAQRAGRVARPAGAASRALRGLGARLRPAKPVRPGTGEAATLRPGTPAAAATTIAEIGALRARLGERGSRRVKGEAREALRSSARAIGEEVDGIWRTAQRSLDAADPKTSPAMEWTRLLAADPGKDWGYMGQVEVLREAQGALQRVEQARVNIAYLSRHQGDVTWLAGASGVKIRQPSAQALEQARGRVEATRAKIESTLRSIKIGQLSEMMRLDELGRDTGISLDGVRGVFQAGSR